MLSDYEAATKATFMACLEKELRFIALHPNNARDSHAAAVALIEDLGRFELIGGLEAQSFLDEADEALLSAIKTLKARRSR
jgi:hypothetical protein